MKKLILIISVLLCITSREAVKSTVSRSPSESPTTAN
jgi:hypothetical protein